MLYWLVLKGKLLWIASFLTRLQGIQHTLPRVEEKSIWSVKDDNTYHPHPRPRYPIHQQGYTCYKIRSTVLSNWGPLCSSALGPASSTWKHPKDSACHNSLWSTLPWDPKPVRQWVSLLLSLSSEQRLTEYSIMHTATSTHPNLPCSSMSMWFGS